MTRDEKEVLLVLHS